MAIWAALHDPGLPIPPHRVPSPALPRTALKPPSRSAPPPPPAHPTTPSPNTPPHHAALRMNSPRQFARPFPASLHRT